MNLLLLIPLLLSSADHPISPAKAASSEPFKCMLALSIDGSLDDRWERTSPAGGVKIPSTSHVVKQQVFTACVFCANFTRDAKNRVDVRYDLSITKPDGTSYFEQKDIPAWKEVFKGSTSDILLAKSLVRVSFDPPDPLGDYTVAVTVRDTIGKSQDKAVRKLALKEYDEGDDFDDKDALVKWFGGYRAAPDPERAIPALLAFSKQGGFAHGDVHPDAMGFFRTLLTANPWLVPILVERIGDLEAGARHDVLRVLARTDRKAKGLAEKLDESGQAEWKELTARPAHDPMTDPIEGRDDINELFGDFLASGQFAPVARLCDALAPEETDAVADTTIKEKTTGVDVPLRKVVPDVLMKQIAGWPDPLFRSYCEWIVASPKTPEAVRAQLEKALQPR